MLLNGQVWKDSYLDGNFYSVLQGELIWWSYSRCVDFFS